MKTQTQQPAHTKGELGVTNNIDRIHSGEWRMEISAFINNEVRNTVAYAYGRTQEEAEANAQRIVTAVNEYDENKRKADMHDELVGAIKMMLWAEENGEYEAQKQGKPRLITRLEKLRDLLKQAEQK